MLKFRRWPRPTAFYRYKLRRLVCWTGKISLKCEISSKVEKLTLVALSSSCSTWAFMVVVVESLEFECILIYISTLVAKTHSNEGLTLCILWLIPEIIGVVNVSAVVASLRSDGFFNSIDRPFNLYGPRMRHAFGISGRVTHRVTSDKAYTNSDYVSRLSAIIFWYLPLVMIDVREIQGPIAE